MFRIRYILLCLSLLIGGTKALRAQYASGGTPRSLQSSYSQRSNLRSAVQTDTIRLSPPVQSELSKATKEANQANELRPYRFALPLSTSLSTKQGQWQREDDGSYIWTLTIRAEGATSLGLHFARYRMPEGAKLFVHGTSGIVRGAFTELNNSDDSKLNIAPIQGDWLTLELNLNKGLSPESVQISIDAVYYGYRDINARGIEGRASDKWAIGEPLYNLNGTGLSRMSCAPNVVAYPEYANQSRATLLLIAEGSFLSTGTLINNTRQDGTAYVLTAAHNLNRIYDEDIITETPNDPTTLAKVREISRTMIFFFGFESPSQDQDIRGSEEKTLAGAELVAYDEEHDMALLRITGLPTDQQGIARIPNSYNAYFAGWNLSTTPQSTFYGIHHALGVTKRVCIAEDQSISLYDYSINKSFQYLNRDIAWTDAHWRINAWQVGTTEAGASGSPLFDGNGLVIGALTGGRSTCNAPFRDHYYSIARAWGSNSDGRDNLFKLSPWLDPSDSGIERLEGLDPHRTNPIKRISTLFGQRTLGKLTSYSQQDQVSGLGRVIRLGQGASPLGIFIQIGAMQAGQLKRPNYIVELSPINQGIVGRAVWSTQLDNYSFVRYSQRNSAFELGERTIGEDEVELFIPGQVTTSLPEGRYLLSLRTDNDTELDYPILMEQYRTTSNNYSRGVWAKTIGGEWALDTKQAGGLWLDLLYNGDRGESGNDIPEQATDRYTSYAHKQQIFIQNPRGEATARIYDLLGQLYMETTLSEGENIISTNALLPNQIYIIQIKGALGTLSYKFRPSN